MAVTKSFNPIENLSDPSQWIVDYIVQLLLEVQGLEL